MNIKKITIRFILAFVTISLSFSLNLIENKQAKAADEGQPGYPIPTEYRPNNAPQTAVEGNPDADKNFRYNYIDFWGTVGDIAKVLISVAGMLAVFFITSAGFKYVTSGGRQEELDAAKNTLKWAFLGLITVLLSYVLVDFVITIVQNIAKNL